MLCSLTVREYRVIPMGWPASFRLFVGRAISPAVTFGREIMLAHRVRRPGRHLHGT